MMDADFFEVADEFIQLANELNEEWTSELLSAAILYAAARYNAHHFLQQSKKGTVKVDQAVAFYVDQYRKMLGENIPEIIEALNPGASYESIQVSGS